MAHTGWAVSAPREFRCWTLHRESGGKRLWKRRSVEKSKNRLFHCAWKSRPRRGIPTFPQPRRRRTSNMNLEPDRSCATKTGHLHVLPTQRNCLFQDIGATREERPFRRSQIDSLPAASTHAKIDALGFQTILGECVA